MTAHGTVFANRDRDRGPQTIRPRPRTRPGSLVARDPFAVLFRWPVSAFLGVAEAAARSGADRLARFRCARGEASEAAAALDAVVLLGLAPAAQVEPVVVLLSRLHAMLTRLARAGR